MTLRAADKKDEHGWQILEDEEVVAHATSRDKARAFARGDAGAEATYVNGAIPGRDIDFVKVPPLPPEAIEALKDFSVEGLEEVFPPDKRTPEEKAADEARAVDQRIRQNMAIQKGLWLQLAADLYVFKEGRMWEALGYASFSAYVADADTDMEPRWAYQLVEMYGQLVVDRGVDPERLKGLHVTKIRAVLPAIRREQVTVEEAFSDCEALPKRDLETKYSGKASPTPGKPDTGTKIHTDNEPQYMRCPTCGSRVEVDSETGHPKGAS